MNQVSVQTGIFNPQAFADIQARIAAARARGPNAAPEVTLVAVTKAFPVQALVSGYEGGLRVFGEYSVVIISGRFF